MMKPRRVLLALLLVWAAAAPAAAEPYRLDGLRLGMTLAELRASPAIGAGNRVICNIDREADNLRPQPDYVPPRTPFSDAAPICGLYRFGARLERSSTLPPEWYPTGIRLGAVDVFPAFHFVADESGEKAPRLASIALRANASLWDTLVATLGSRYGRPATRERPEPTAGAPYADNEIAGWDNGDSTIRAVKRSDRYQRSTITLEHSALAALARWRAAGGAMVR